MRKFYKIISFVSISILIMTNAQAQDWNITDAQRSLTLGVPYTMDIQDEGMAIFNTQCKMCHGEPEAVAKNDKATPNLGAIDIQERNNDGEFFAKLTNGKGGTAMTAYGERLSETERWKIIAYLRTFYDGYEPPVADAGGNAPKVEKFKGTIKDIEAIYNDDKQSFTVKLIAVDTEGHLINAPNVKVDFLIKRKFGDMALAAGQRTDANGQITVDASGLKADTTGVIYFIARTSDKKIKKESSINYAEPYVWQNPIEGRHLWGKSSRTPLWLLFMYLGVTLTVLGIIGWAFFQLFRIWMLREQ